jgi:hypothetical protein
MGVDMNDPFALVRDARLRDAVADLDRIGVGLRDLQVEHVLNDRPDLQADLHAYACLIRLAADLLAQMREESHRR